MDLESQLEELKYDYIRLQNDLEKKESLNQQIDPLVKQLEEIEKKFQIYVQNYVRNNFSIYLGIKVHECYDISRNRKDVIK